MKITYVGPHDEVRLPLPGARAGREVVVARGESIDLDALVPEHARAEFADGLLAQEANWVKTAARTRAADKQPADEAAEKEA